MWAQAIAGLGLDAEQKAASAGQDDTHYLWPECVPIWHAWQAVQTQWRTGMAGATGLCYSGVRAWLADNGPPDADDRREWWACIQAAERATLDVWAEQRRQQEQQQQHP